MDLPYLDVHNADVLEPPHHLTNAKYPSLSHPVFALLLKLKLLVDVRNLRIMHQGLAHKNIIQDPHQAFELATLRSPLSVRFQQLTTGDLIRAELRLKRHALMLGGKIMEVNSNFMFSLFDPDEALLAPPHLYSSGSINEADLALLQQSYNAFWEAEGVLALFQGARACAAHDSEDEIEDIMKGKAFRSGERSARSAEELLSDVSVNRVWGYLGCAIENAAYLGPWEERPSIRDTREIREYIARAMAEEEEEDIWDDEMAGADDDE